MNSLNLASFIFLVVLFVLTPRAALRSARQLRQTQADGTMPPRTRIVLSTMFALTIVWFISAMNASAMGINLFSLPRFGARELLIGVAALGILLLTIPITRALRKPEDERRRLLYSFAPRNAREYALWVLVAIMAGIAEESAYRGVAVWILTPIMGSIIPAIFLSAMAFGVAHAVQGAQTMIVTFIFAIAFQAVVYFTDTLVIAMVVHAVYDMVAGLIAQSRMRAFAAAEVSAPPPTPAG